MAVRAVKDPCTPQVVESRDRGKLILEPCRDENVAGLENLAAGKFYLPRPVLGSAGEFLHRSAGYGSAEFLHLRVTALEQFGRDRAVEAKDAMGMFAEAIAGSTGIENLNIAVSARQRDGRGGAGKATADDDDVWLYCSSFIGSG